MRFTHVAIALFVGVVFSAGHAVAGQLKFNTCLVNARGQYFQFGPQRILADAKRSVVGKTLTYFPYEAPISLTTLKVGTSLLLTFSETGVDVTQAGQKYAEPVEYRGNTWCQQNRLTGQRECLAVLAIDDALQTPLPNYDIPGVGAIHGFLGRWVDNDFCRASVLGVFRIGS